MTHLDEIRDALSRAHALDLAVALAGAVGRGPDGIDNVEAYVNDDGTFDLCVWRSPVDAVRWIRAVYGMPADDQTPKTGDL